MRVALIALLLVLSSVPVASAAEHHEVTVYAHEGDDCPEGRSFCYTIDGDLSGLVEGDEVTFTLVNEGNVEHELVAGPLAMADPDHKATDEDAAIGEIAPIAVGDSDSATFTVPEGGLYIFCGIEGHEAAGMWHEIPAAPGEDAGVPGPALLTVVAGLLAAASVVRRRV